ncbi:hypothetical protein KIN20_023847 [Parelaphostrongylus tenuis]|uniref:Uncharacterized protein n=1 Tax=Parelaphostrongylus tenuis TaxID=148309 RepID=A0AAD5MXI6_PARTN|nr:hypothetical protein KIN20_023847 [Parelaphostrongylus tenuis]
MSVGLIFTCANIGLGLLCGACESSRRESGRFSRYQDGHDGAIAALKELTSSIKDFIKSHDDLRKKEIVLFSSLRDIEQLHVKARETGDLHYVIDNTFASLSASKCGNKGVAACVHSALTKAYSRHEVSWQL